MRSDHADRCADSAFGMTLSLHRMLRPICLTLALLAHIMSANIASAQQRCDTSALPSSLPTSAFTDNADGTVTDRRSGLQWMRCSIGQRWSLGSCVGAALPLSWQAAKQHADRINASGEWFYADWRLPNLRELATITERQCSNPRTNLELFPQTVAGDYWTSVARAVGAYEPDVFTIGFGAQGVSFAHPSSEKFARLVRTAH